jgi:formylglycine-generating enzyme required for sulfatase activity
MLVVTPGEFEVSDESGQSRTLRVDRTIALGWQEITVAEFLRFRPDHAVETQTAQSDDCPVNLVSWYAAAAYCNWLSKEEGIGENEWCYVPNEKGDFAAGMKVKANAQSLSGYRLPTSEEWEYACRAATVTPWSIGEAAELLDRYSWSISNAGMRSHPVRLLRPNDLGFFDMHGNVWEWCQERSDDQGVVQRHASESEETVDDQNFRALRGGTFLNDPAGVASATLNGNPPEQRTGADGFRIARTIR